MSFTLYSFGLGWVGLDWIVLYCMPGRKSPQRLTLYAAILAKFTEQGKAGYALISFLFITAPEMATFVIPIPQMGPLRHKKLSFSSRPRLSDSRAHIFYTLLYTQSLGVPLWVGG